MKAITLHQPWASLIALGVKTIETRSWSTAHRGPIAIHAAVKFDREGWEQRLDVMTKLPGMSPVDWLLSASPAVAPRGVVVATADLVDCVPMIHVEDGDWSPEPHLAIRTDIEIGEFAHLDLRNTTINGDVYTLGFAVEDQLPYGDFAPGRWAWLLADIVPFDKPIPARGQQRLWNWNPPTS